VENIEIKVRLPAKSDLRSAVASLFPANHGIFVQHDTYYAAHHGRLKLRRETTPSGAESATLIAYSRPDDTTSRISHYHLLDVPDPDELHTLLDTSLGVIATVRKTRHLLIFGRTRIHLDHVDGLGSFVELETVITDQGDDEPWREHHNVREALSLDEYEPVRFSYSDLILQDLDDQSDREHDR
jgi:predicted adenylyl cyclase CyaB